MGIQRNVNIDNLTSYKSNYTGKVFENAITSIRKSVAVNYDTNTSYIVDDFVIYDGQLYQCHTNTVAGEFNSSYWTACKIFDDYDIIKDGNSELSVIKLNQFTVDTTLTSLTFQYIE